MDLIEKGQIKKMMDNYKNIHQELDHYQKILERMSSGVEEKNENTISIIRNKIEACIRRLENERISESNFYKSLKEKYGPGEFDTQTFEYKRSI